MRWEKLWIGYDSFCGILPRSRRKNEKCKIYKLTKKKPCNVKVLEIQEDKQNVAYYSRIQFGVVKETLKFEVYKTCVMEYVLIWEF